MLLQPTCNGALLEIFRVDYVELHPSIIHHRLSPICGTLSYGLYRYSSNEEVVAHITRLMEKVPEGDPAHYLIAEFLFRAAKRNR